MFKRITSIILSLLILSSVTSALAAENITHTDNFEQHNITEDTEYTSAQLGSSVFYLNGGNGTLMYNAGKDNSKALKIAASNADIAVMTRLSHDQGNTEVLELSFDLKAGYNTTGKLITLGARNSVGDYPVFTLGYDADNQLGTFLNSEGTVLSTYSKDRWYRVVLRLTKEGLKKGYIYDDTGSVIAQGTYERYGVKTLHAVSIKAGSGMEVILDNTRLKHYDKNNAPSLIESDCSVIDNAEGVQRNKTLSFVFDQEITSDSAISITRADGEEITEITSITTTKRYNDTLILNYNGLLDRNTEYVISFADVSNGTQTCGTADISFTTEDLHIWNDVVVSSAEANEDDGALTNITFEIGDKYGYSVFTGSVMAVLYQDGKMLKEDIKPLLNTPTGELTVSFALGTLPSDYDIGIILLDLGAGPIPLAGGMLEN